MKKIVLIITILCVIGCKSYYEDGVYQTSVVENGIDFINFSNSDIFVTENKLQKFDKSSWDIDMSLIDKINKLKEGEIVIITIDSSKIVGIEIK